LQPAEFVELARVGAARRRHEGGEAPCERVAARCDFTNRHHATPLPEEAASAYTTMALSRNRRRASGYCSNMIPRVAPRDHAFRETL
jgi:hypothetical protein